NAMGGEAKFPGILITSICKLFDYNIGMTGLSEREAKKMGYDIVSSVCPAPDKPHFMQNSKPIIVKVIAEKSTGKLIGIQVIGLGDVSKRVDIMAMALTNEMTAFELANVDLAYAPPFSPAMDNIITAANVLENKRQGIMDGISVEEVYEKIENGEDIFLLDIRGDEEWEWRHLANSTHIPIGELRNRLDEIPKDKEIIAYCKISLRGYEAALILEANGFENVKVMDGGLLAWPYKYETGK
ncbi:MAG: pyridine nucleotide-disulfide oxidoreductase, partial [Candidatus Heimdallarchaeota archaeon]|nr:pyridine nucleotide-disulfide oxidoreductase [Candidatus Heimdallarchaeota archaeon]MCK5048181.1 pyridine nucleotide-disulfide oxidoreductase [Candidatus Heimdallarchaeota archaeon]